MGIRWCKSQSGGIEFQAGLGESPEFFKAQSPRTDVGRIIENQRAAREIELEAAHAMFVVGKQVGIGKVTQVVRALPDVDGVGKPGDEPNQSRSNFATVALLEQRKIFCQW